MPNKRNNNGLHDIIGLVLLSLSLLLFAALFSFNKEDLASVKLPPNAQTHNWVGPAGAMIANFCFFTFGAAAFLLPFLIFVTALGFLFSGLEFFRRRWIWSIILVLSSSCILEIHNKIFPHALQSYLNAPSPGGIVGIWLNDGIFRFFGIIGATIILATLYLISLMSLSNCMLQEWIQWIVSLFKRRTDEADLYQEKLEKRKQELEQQARELEEEIRKTGLGPDLQPVPEPTIRDLSVPQHASTPPTPEPEQKEITAEEKHAPEEKASGPAKVMDILGHEPPAKPTDVKPTDEPAKDKDQLLAEPKDQSNRLNNTAGQPQQRRTKPLSVAIPPKIGNYQLPPIDLLNLPEPVTRPTESKDELLANARLMQQTLAQFDIEVSVGDITKGPTITRYELHPAPGVRLERIAALSNNLAAALKAENVHILAPIPGKSAVGVEVPNVVKSKVILRDILISDEWKNTKAKIPLAIGKDVYGHPIIPDLAEMPHLLIAGSTGSGKSVCINTIIASLLYKFPPDQLRFVMIDPKVVELQQYNRLPHLVVPVITDPKKVVLALRWVVNEMDKRYQIFARVGVRNIKSFNERPKTGSQSKLELSETIKSDKSGTSTNGFAVELDEEMTVPDQEDIIIPDKLSYVVVVVDELADLMLVAPADVEMLIARITQMARAAGIHCIIATQRPSVDVITGVIKANIPARIAFQVASKVDSRTILDAMGADKLLGKGDMLYLPPGSSKLIRAQGALITDQEIENIVEFIAKQGKPSYDMEIHQQLSKPETDFTASNTCNEEEELIQKCIEVIRSEQKASVSLLQRRLRLGYTRAARIMDELENRGIVGPSKGAEPRDILIDLDANDHHQNQSSEAD